MHTDRIRQLDRRTRWELTDTVPVDGDVGHPQGMTRWGEHGTSWLVSTVHPRRGRGELIVVGDDGSMLAVLDVTDGERIHPGGLSADGTGCWVAVAEYRPESTTLVHRLDRELNLVTSFRFDDHLGAICELADHTLFAVSWGSRRWYRLDADGHVLDQRPDPNHYVEIQDLQQLDGGHVTATAVGQLRTPDGSMQLGGITLIDTATLSCVHETPVAAWMPSGRAATYNASHLEFGEHTTLQCLVDDTSAAIGTWRAVTRR